VVPDPIASSIAQHRSVNRRTCRVAPSAPAGRCRSRGCGSWR
jgi:hypothetical protein